MYNFKNIILFSLIALSSGSYAMEINLVCQSLFDACQEGDLDTVKLLCTRINNINNVTRRRRVIDQYSRDYIVTAPRCDGKEALLGFVCEKNQFDIVKYLVEEMKADVETAGINPKSKFKDVPLVRASSKKIRQYLFEHGADPYLKFVDGRDAEYFSFDKFEDPAGVAQAAIDRGYNVNRLSATDETPLMKIGNNKAVAQCFINNGANLNFQDYCGMTPLSLANEGGHYDVAKLLISKGASLTLPGEEREMNQFLALIMALYHANLDFFNYLLKEESIDINIRVNGDTLLHDVASQSLFDSMKEKGLPRKRVTNLDNKDLVVFLLCKGANPLAKNTLGQMPADTAKHTNVRRILRNEDSVRKAIIEHTFKDQKLVKFLKNYEITGNQKLLSY